MFIVRFEYSALSWSNVKLRVFLQTELIYLELVEIEIEYSFCLLLCVSITLRINPQLASCLARFILPVQHTVGLLLRTVFSLVRMEPKRVVTDTNGRRHIWIISSHLYLSGLQRRSDTVSLLKRIAIFKQTA